MIQSKEDMRFYIQEDKKRNLGANVSTLKYIAKWLYGTDDMKAFRLLRALRKLEYAKNCLRQKGIIGKLIYAYRQYRYHRLEEKYDIAIGSMGNYCGANVGVVIGNNHTWDERPVIGDYVGFSIGSKAYGNIHIGNHVVVAPNSVVIKDVPNNCVVSGVPAKIIKTGFVNK